MSSLAEVALRAGVSKATASRALSGALHVSLETRDRVTAAAADLGYVVSSSAASLVTGRTQTIGVLTPFINRWFFAEVIEGIESALVRKSYDLTLYRVGDDPEQRRQVFEYYLVRKRVDAVITVGLSLAPEEVAQLHALGGPAVGTGGTIAGMMTMSIDDVAAGSLVTEHLLSLGHRRIVHLGGGSDEQRDFHAHAGRLEGFRSAMAAAGIQQDDDLRLTPFTIPGGYEVALELLAHPHSRPTAIVAGCDEIAIGAITAARQLGIQVPAQLSVVGIDDHSLADMFGLTTVRQDPRGQGSRAVEILMADLASGRRSTDTRELPVPTSLRVRSSTTAPTDS
ncbi:LacI family DNA-binding transcriptional regulator [soil metagenome]